MVGPKPNPLPKMLSLAAQIISVLMTVGGMFVAVVVFVLGVWNLNKEVAANRTQTEQAIRAVQDDVTKLRQELGQHQDDLADQVSDIRVDVAALKATGEALKLILERQHREQYPPNGNNSFVGPEQK